MFRHPFKPAVAGLAVVLMLGMAACGSSDSGSIKAKAYSRDGLLGTTGANPNLPLTKGYHDYASDARLLKDSIAQIPGVTDSTIVLNGPTAYVTLQLDERVDIEESMRIRGLAQQQLARMMPRYDVQVSVGKNVMN